MQAVHERAPAVRSLRVARAGVRSRSVPYVPTAAPASQVTGVGGNTRSNHSPDLTSPLKQIPHLRPPYLRCVGVIGGRQKMLSKLGCFLAM